MLARQVLKRGAPAVARRQAGLVSVCVTSEGGVYVCVWIKPGQAQTRRPARSQR